MGLFGNYRRSNPAALCGSCLNKVDRDAEGGMSKPNTPSSVAHYNLNYGNFQANLYAEIRCEAFGEDIGQNSWHTADEQDRFLTWLELSPGQKLLDVACGAGGPALRIAAATGCSMAGVDVHEQAVETARALATERGLSERAEFQVADANRPLPFGDASFDAITCIDAINHFADRFQMLSEWARLLKPGGRMLFTDPIIVTGPLANSEIAVRTSAGFYLVVPKGYDELVIAESGLQLLLAQDVTANMAKVAEARRKARAARRDALCEIEGKESYETEQEFLTVTARLASEGRLSRFVFVAKKV
jgi:cyclopropane fatty-acyl-phospholipid synthase-like methyltransferase